jgi:hypothetical protein
MKRLFNNSSFAVLGSTALFAQDQDQDRLMLVDGDVLQIRDRDQIRLQDKIILTNGTTVNQMVLSRKRGGDRLRLRGECLDMNGVKYSNGINIDEAAL